jgi:hypothetical protein
MDSVGSVLLGYSPADRLANARRLVKVGLPNGVLLRCLFCNRILERDPEETAKAILFGWPKCHDRAMIPEDRDRLPF